MKVCRECGSANVYWDAYVGVNDPEDVRTFDNVFCDDCEVQTSLVGVKNED